MKIVIGNDHAGTEYKFAVMRMLQEMDVTVVNYGTDDVLSVDYPDFIHPVAKAVENNTADFGIILCGSGNGAAITANKHQKVRAAICWNKELAMLARKHNNANILSIPSRFIALSEVLEIVKVFLETEFEGGRHQNRIDKIPLRC